MISHFVWNIKSSKRTILTAHAAHFLKGKDIVVDTLKRNHSVTIRYNTILNGSPSMPYYRKCCLDEVTHYVPAFIKEEMLLLMSHGMQLMPGV